MDNGRLRSRLNCVSLALTQHSSNHGSATAATAITQSLDWSSVIELHGLEANPCQSPLRHKWQISTEAAAVVASSVTRANTAETATATTLSAARCAAYVTASLGKAPTCIRMFATANETQSSRSSGSHDKTIIYTNATTIALFVCHHLVSDSTNTATAIH